MKSVRSLQREAEREKKEYTEAVERVRLAKEQLDLEVARRVAEGLRVSGRLPAEAAAQEKLPPKPRTTITMSDGAEVPISKEAVAKHMDMKLQSLHPRVKPLGRDRFGNAYWVFPWTQVSWQKREPVLLLVEHATTGTLHSYRNVEDVGALLSFLNARGESESVLHKNLLLAKDCVKEGIAKLAQLTSLSEGSSNTKTSQSATTGYLSSVAQALCHIADSSCVGARFKEWKYQHRQSWSERVEQAALLDPKVALECFKVEVQNFAEIVDGGGILHWADPIHRLQWMNAVCGSHTFAQVVFFMHRAATVISSGTSYS